MNLLHKYKNGNYTVSIYNDGTKIRETEEDKFISSFPENIDIKISDKCDGGCEFCHENSTINGDIANFNYEFLYTLRKGTELAIGGGNIFENENLSNFLEFCKNRGIIANITANQIHLNNNYYEIFDWIDTKKVYGVGISYNGNADELDKIFNTKVYEDVSLGNGFSSYEKISANKYKSNCVIHVINGVHSYENIMKLANKNYKILILGYKDLRRGTIYKEKCNDIIIQNQKSIYDNIHKIINAFDVISFDNLAIEQLNIRRLFTSEQWEEFYMGDDGQFTMYIDLVKGEFAKNSISLKRYKILDTIDKMFKMVKSET